MLWSRLGWPLSIVAAVACGCDTGPEPVKADQAQAYIKSKDRPAFPVPKTVVDVEKIGIPVFPGSVLGEGENSRVDDRSFHRTYFVKMYAPAVPSDVATYYFKGLKQSKKLGGAEEQQIIGQNAFGDEIDVRIGPAADKSKSLVMVWMSQAK